MMLFFEILVWVSIGYIIGRALDKLERRILKGGPKQ